VADYERSNFTVSQTLFSDNTTSQIVAIQPINTPTSGSSLSKGALTAIIVAVIVACLLLATGGYIYYSHITKKKESALRAQEQRDALAAVLVASRQMEDAGGENQIHEAFAPKPAELVGDQRRISELQGSKMEHELPGQYVVRVELEGENFSAYRLNEMQ
jgi:uncharacterized protein HemX